MNEAKRVKLRVSFGYENLRIGIISKLTYQLARFDLLGNFYGFETLSDQLLLCQTPAADVEKLRQFGTTLDSTCNFDLSRLISSSEYDHHKYQNMFFEMYIKDFNDDLIDVPVLVKNMQDKNGNKPNADSSAEQESNWRLTRRFFLLDTKSGVEGTDNFIKGESSTVVRYAKQMTIRIKLDPNNPEMIYPPLLIIDYRERSKTTIAANSLAKVTFSSEYQMNSDKTVKTIGDLTIVCLAFFVVLVIVQVIVWCNLPQLGGADANRCNYYFVKIILSMFSVFSSVFFWFLVIVSGYWFIFFKL